MFTYKRPFSVVYMVQFQGSRGSLSLKIFSEKYMPVIFYLKNFIIDQIRYSGLQNIRNRSFLRLKLVTTLCLQLFCEFLAKVKQDSKTGYKSFPEIQFQKKFSYNCDKKEVYLLIVGQFKCLFCKYHQLNSFIKCRRITLTGC